MGPTKHSWRRIVHGQTGSPVTVGGWAPTAQLLRVVKASLVLGMAVGKRFVEEISGVRGSRMSSIRERDGACDR